MTGHARLSVFCVASVLGGLGLASSAQAGWSPPFTVAHSVAEGPVLLATSPTHGAALAWSSADDHVLRVRRLGPDGALRRVTRVPGPVEGESFPHIAIGESGAIVVVWTHWAFDTGSTLFARRVGKHGRLGAIRTIDHDPEGSEDLDERLAMDAAGNATIVWNRVHLVPGPPHADQVTSSAVCIRRFSAAGSLGPVNCLPSGGGFDRFARLAVGPSGRGALSWIRQLNGRITVHALLIRRNGALGPARDASPPQEFWSGGAAEVAVDGSGRATLAWSQSGPGDGVTIRQLSSHGLGPLRALTSSAGAGQPRVAASPSGAATVAWVEDPGYRVKAVHIRRSGVLGPVRSLSAPSSVSTGVALGLAADGLGNTTVVYNAELPGRKPRSVVQARRFSSGGRLGKPWNLSPKGKVGVIWPVAVVADARGVVTALVYNRASRFVP